MTMPAMVTVPITDTAQMRRLTEVAADVAQLADERIDLDLRKLIDHLAGRPTRSEGRRRR
jgi:hypothetical protein